MSMQKARDSSSETKDVIKAEEEGVKEDGKLTYSRLQEWEADERFGIQACCV